MEEVYNKIFEDFKEYDNCFEIIKSQLIPKLYNEIQVGSNLIVVTNNRKVLLGIKESPLEIYLAKNFYAHYFTFTEKYLKLICGVEGQVKDSCIIAKYFPQQIIDLIAEIETNEFKKILGELFLRTH